MNSTRNQAPEALRTRAILALALTAALWSTSGLLIKLVAWNPIAIAGARSLIAAGVLFAYLRRPRFTWSLDQIAAAIAYAATMLTFVIANKLTTSANAIFLQYLSPVFVALLGVWLLGERPRPIEWIIIFVVIAGMGLFFVGRLSPAGMLGNIVAITSGVCFASFIVLMRRQAAGSPLESMLLGHLVTAIVSVPFWFTGAPAHATGWLAIGALGFVQIGLTSITFSFAVKHMTALSTSIITLIEPVLNPLWVFLFVGEVPSLAALAGGIVILSMVTLRSILTVRLPQQETVPAAPPVKPQGSTTPHPT